MSQCDEHSLVVTTWRTYPRHRNVKNISCRRNVMQISWFHNLMQISYLCNVRTIALSWLCDEHSLVFTLWWTLRPRYIVTQIWFHHNVTKISCHRNMMQISCRPNVTMLMYQKNNKLYVTLDIFYKKNLLHYIINV